MNELVKINVSAKTGNPVVNARDLHVFLEVKQDFSNWLKGRIKKYGFAENVDYARIFYDIEGRKIQFAKNSESDSQALKRVYRIEYALTLDCAKELSMVQNNEKGRQARQYFIDVEKRYKELKQQVKPAITLYTMSEVAKKLNLSDFYGKIGRNSLFNILQYHKIVDEKSRPFPKYVKSGYFINNPVRVTEEGLKWLNQKFCVETADDTKELRNKVETLQRNQELMLEGMASVVETLLFNKGGHRTEEQNRQSISHLQKFLETVNTSPKALK